MKGNSASIASVAATAATTQASSSSSSSSSAFLQIAEDAAKLATQEWVRSVFEETFCQAIKQRWRVKSCSNDGSDDDETEDEAGRLRVEISLDMTDVDDCWKFVERVSEAWKTSLINDEGHEIVAGWVDEVYRTGKETFWMDDNLNLSMKIDDGDDQDDGGGETKESDTHNSCSGQPTTATGIATTARTRTGTGTTIEGTTSPEDLIDHNDNDKESPDVHPQTMIPYCELRLLGQRVDVDEAPMTIQKALERIKMLSHNSVTYWPADPTIIDETLKSTKKRMDLALRRGGGVKKKTRFDIPNDELSGSSREGRRSRRQPSSQPSTTGRPSTSNTSGKGSVNDQSSDASVMARPPYDIPSHVHVQDLLSPNSLSLHEKKSLDELVPDETHTAVDTTSTESKPAPLCLFGRLQPVGKVNQRLLEQDNEAAKGEFRVTMQTSFDAACRQERLDPRRVQGREGDDIKRFKSVILKTEDWTERGRKCFDIDMGYSLLEVLTDQSRSSVAKRRRLCAFSSIEMTLDDIDAPMMDRM